MLSPQSTIAAAAAAAAAAACANDPNKFQALLMERTKALAAEALKNGSGDAANEGESSAPPLSRYSCPTGTALPAAPTVLALLALTARGL